ncbi:MAG: response regulator transcription factor, partial [Sandarakinorhabdus sp.]
TRIHTMAAALRQEHQDLRNILERIRPRQPAAAETGRPMTTWIPMLAEQWDISIDADISAEPPAGLADEIRPITREAIWIDNGALKRVITDLTKRDARAAATRPLSARETEVARLAARGLRNRDIATSRHRDIATSRHRDIAQALGLTESTVKMHMGHAFDKLGVASRAELAALARDLGLA